MFMADIIHDRVGFDKRAQERDVARVVARLVLRGLQQEGGVRELGGAGDAGEGCGADVAEADVPVAVDARVVGGARVVEVDGADVARADVLRQRVERGGEAVLFAYVVAGGEGVGRVEADAEVERGAALD
jgi:hypothetical protein